MKDFPWTEDELHHEAVMGLDGKGTKRCTYEEYDAFKDGAKWAKEYIERDIGLAKWAIDKAIPALKTYAESTDSTKMWCSMGDGVSTKWFHGVASGDVAKEALEALPDVNLVEDFIKNGKGKNE